MFPDLVTILLVYLVGGELLELSVWPVQGVWRAGHCLGS